MSRPAGPFPDSYWVEPGRLCAGEYPFAQDPTEALQKLRRICAAGVDTFIDLTEEGEYGLAPYAHHLEVPEYVRLPIADLDVPTAGRMNEILDSIDDALSRGRIIYVHCLRRRRPHRDGRRLPSRSTRRDRRPRPRIDCGMAPRDTDGDRNSPETSAQRNFVAKWRG